VRQNIKEQNNKILLQNLRLVPMVRKLFVVIQANLKKSVQSSPLLNSILWQLHPVQNWDPNLKFIIIIILKFSHKSPKVVVMIH